LSRAYQKYSPEFREEVSRMVVETSRAIADVAREYKINETTVGNWADVAQSPWYDSGGKSYRCQSTSSYQVTCTACSPATASIIARVSAQAGRPG
jgi:transposase-like protein